MQSCIIELSKNNAFSGKQQSVGERSLLTITQEVAKAYADKDLNHIVQFSDMYEGLRGILQTKIQSDIQQAERTLGDDLALKVLKTLFLIKYVKGFPSTADNITKLLLPTLDTDFQTFRSDIHEALNKLVHLSYIEKAANEEYHFQTNEEKDIETEIKNESLTPDAINEELKKVFRDEIYYENKVKLSPNKIFSYGKMVDERQGGKSWQQLPLHLLGILYPLGPDTTLSTDDVLLLGRSQLIRARIQIIYPLDARNTLNLVDARIADSSEIFRQYNGFQRYDATNAGYGQNALAVHA